MARRILLNLCVIVKNKSFLKKTRQLDKGRREHTPTNPRYSHSQSLPIALGHSNKLDVYSSPCPLPPITPMLAIRFSASQNSFRTKITLNAGGGGGGGKLWRELEEKLQFNLFSMVSQGLLARIAGQALLARVLVSVTIRFLDFAKTVCLSLKYIYPFGPILFIST